MHLKLWLAFLVSTTLALGGCKIGDDDDKTALFDEDNPLVINKAPTISGSPTARIQEGVAYEFTPTASDADGDTLEFSISRKPSWASFDGATGRLWGTPQTADAGNFTNIGIAVSDGKETAELSDFHITVDQISLGSFTLSWQPPTQNVDGSVLTNLSGYRIYYGRSANTLDQLITLSNPGLTRYVVENLSSATWYFTMTAINSNGTESGRSATASKTIS